MLPQLTTVAAGVALILATGCATPSPHTSPTGARTNAVEQVLVPQTTPGAGLITSVEPTYQFVVISFRGRTMPPVGSVFKVYRAGQPVGSVRLTEPTRGWLATGDIVDGQLHVGDEVR